MKIIICGMPRSMTTWIFNAAREILGDQPLKTIWIDPKDVVAEAEFVSTKENIIAKCHHYSDTLANAADCIIYSYRDIRTAAVSCFRKFSSDCTASQLEAWVQAGRAWVGVADVIMRYEKVERNPSEALQRLRHVLGVKYGAQRLSRESDETLLSRVDLSFERRQTVEKIDYDSRTMILPAHRTFQPSPDDLNEIEKALYLRIEREFAAWLVEHFYLQQEDHGQALDYRLAAQIMSRLSSPTVIDVGVERGSFVDLALAAGAGRVIAFEALPRHVTHLRSRFGDDSGVEVRAQAVSEHFGKAVFHIALDPEGRELDYHHTLADLGDSATVVRSARTIEVETVALGGLAKSEQLPGAIDFLKVDTDGHDLAVLRGLNTLRPRFILAEYWDTLPETSGRNLYSLADLQAWATGGGYEHSVVIRRHGRLESLEWDAPWTRPGDWGNVLFIRDTADLPLVQVVVAELASEAQARNQDHVAILIKDCEAKEAEIRRLDNALKALRSQQQGKEHFLRYTSAAVSALKSMRGPQPAKADDCGGVASHPSNSPISGLGWAQGGQKCPRCEMLEVDLIRKDVAHLKAQFDALKTVQNYLERPNENGWKALSALSDGTAQTPDELESAHCAALEMELARKEAVIQQQARALTAYRAFFPALSPLLRPISFVSRHVRAALRPRLGNLNQYPPRELKLPSPYSTRLAVERLPSISIVTPSFNQAHFLGRTIDSVLGQGYSKLEYFVQDGGSTDGTMEVLQHYGDRLTGWLSEKDDGQSHAINLGFARTKGEIMGWLNSDDLLMPGALHRVGEYFAQHPEVDVVYGHRILIDEQDLEIGRWVLPSHDGKVLSWADFVPQETLFWRRTIWEKAGGQIDESFRFAMDWDLLLRLRDAGARMVRLPWFLGAFRIHEAQKTSAQINEVGMAEMGRLRTRVLGRDVTWQQTRRGLLPYMLKHMAHDVAYRIMR